MRGILILRVCGTSVLIISTLAQQIRLPGEGEPDLLNDGS